MTSQRKIFLITSAVLAGAGILYFGLRYIALAKAYNNNVTEEVANQMIENIASGITDDTIIPDETTDSADAQKGTRADALLENQSVGLCPDGLTWDYELMDCVKIQ